MVYQYYILFVLVSISAMTGCSVRNVDKTQSVAQQYDAVCARCHNSGINEAPIAFDQKIWKTRLAKGIDVLVDNVENGFNKMPPGSVLCKNCNRDDFKALIFYMADS